MLNRTVMSALLLCLLSAGCITPPGDNAAGNQSYNFSLFRIVVNAALFRSTAMSAEAGRSVTQHTTLQAQGNDNLNIPLRTAPPQTAASPYEYRVASTTIPMRINLGVFRAVANSASAGGDAVQRAEVNADGDTDLDVRTTADEMQND